MEKLLKSPARVSNCIPRRENEIEGLISKGWLLFFSLPLLNLLSKYSKSSVKKLISFEQTGHQS